MKIESEINLQRDLLDNASPNVDKLQVKLSVFKQKLNLDIDESGSEGAAVTALCGDGCTYCPHEENRPIHIDFNKPFYAQIVTEKDGKKVPLFSGPITDTRFMEEN